MSNDSEIEEEIKEEIIVDNNDEDKDNKIQCTYDKFLLESVAFEGKPKRNETQNLLKDNMKNIISEIKEKKYENQKSKNSMKKELFSNFLYNDFEDNVIEENENEDKEIVRKLIEEKKEKTINNELNINNVNEDKIRNEPLFEESEIKYENINIDDFIKENNMIYDNEIVNTKINKESNFNNKNNNNLINYNNEKIINNQNETVDNLILSQNQKNKNNNNNNNNNKKLNYIVNGDPSLQQKILDNYNYLQAERNNNGSNNHQKKINSLSKPKTNNSKNNNINYNNNNNDYEEQNPRVFIVDDCKTEEERKIIEQKRQKKLKTLEENIQKRRAKSKSKPEQNIIINSTNDTSITSLQLSKRNNNNPIKIKQNRPITASINSNNKNIKNNNINNTNKSNNKISPNNTKKRPLTSKSNNISHISNIHDTTLSSNVSNISNLSNLTRVPIKIQREESIIANKKVKNVKYNKMSNKKVIIKAINKVCLAGIPNREYREKIIEIINKCTCENYIILFKGNYGSFNLRAVYTFDIDNSNIELLTCINNAPNFIDSSMVTTYYKYNISQNQFKELSGNKEFSVIVDGVCINN